MTATIVSAAARQPEPQPEDMPRTPHVPTGGVLPATVTRLLAADDTPEGPGFQSSI